MAAIAPKGLFSFALRANAPGKSKAAHDAAVRAYNKTNGPTDALKRVYGAYLANKAKSTRRNGAK